MTHLLPWRSCLWARPLLTRQGPFLRKKRPASVKVHIAGTHINFLQVTSVKQWQCTHKNHLNHKASYVSSEAIYRCASLTTSSAKLESKTPERTWGCRRPEHRAPFMRKASASGVWPDTQTGDTDILDLGSRMPWNAASSCKAKAAELTRCSKGKTNDNGATSIKPVPARGQRPIGKSSLWMRTPQRRWPEASYLIGWRLTGAGLEEGTDTGHHQETEVRRPGRAYALLPYPKEHSKRSRYSSAISFLEEAHAAIPTLLSLSWSFGPH